MIKRRQRKQDEARSFKEILREELTEIGRSRAVRIGNDGRVLASGDVFRDALDADLIGLALSGGGVRSATFNLGVLQALAERGLLRRTDYLSTVSGGGYIGTWLTTWIRRRNLADVEHALTTTPEAPEIQFLRKYSNYLTPKVGLFGTDSWTVVTTYIRNLLLHLPALISAALVLLLLPRTANELFSFLSQRRSLWVMALPLGALFLTVILIVVSLLNPSKQSEPARLASHEGPPLRGSHKLVPWMFFLTVWLLAASLGRWSSLGPANLILGAGLLYLGWWFVALIWLDVVNKGALLLKKPLRYETLSLSVAWWAFPAGMLAGTLIWWIDPLFGPGTSPSVYWTPAVTALGLMTAATLHDGLCGKAISGQAREWWARQGATITRIIIVYSLLSYISMEGPDLLSRLSDIWRGLLSWALGSAWLATTILGIFLGGSEGEKAPRPWAAFLMRVAPHVFILGFFLILALLTERIVEASSLSPAWEALVLALAAGLVSYLFSKRIGINRFSMHAFYLNRLVRCYMGASNDRRSPHPFTGFDPGDDQYALSALRTDQAPDSAGSGTYEGPYPIVNATLNLVGGDRLDWQTRKATAFVFTPLYSGFDIDESAGNHRDGKHAAYGYRDSRAYAGGVSPGTAMAISGAAVSPNMGYFSTPSLTFLMTLFNVRLGWWIGNPHHANTWKSAQPSFPLYYLIRETFGRTDDRAKYVYLSDGGHFENLGLYELVRRHCRFIVVSDATEDSGMAFESLGNAIQKCRRDFGIDIEMNVEHIRPDPTGRSVWHCSVGRIRYGRGEDANDGTIVYLKSSLVGDEPQDVASYASKEPRFPHHTTADQWFDEEQFESYRQLGRTIAQEVFPACDVQGSTEYFEALRRKWYPPITASLARHSLHSEALDGLLASLQGGKDLAFLDGQFFPALAKIEYEHDLDSSDRTFLPQSPEQLRQGFYFCCRLLDLMESIYHDLTLERDYDHPDCRGWMNLFQRWWWSRMFKFTWSVSISAHGARFQTFCEERLGFKTGVLGFGKALRASDLPEAEGAAPSDSAPPGESPAAGMNYYEVKFLKEYFGLLKRDTANIVVYPIQVTIEEDPLGDTEMGVSDGREAQPHGGDDPLCLRSDERTETGGFQLNVGFVVLTTEEIPKVLYFRIQNHLRKTGLGRKAVQALLARCPTAELASEQVGSSMETPSSAELRRFYQFFNSLKRSGPQG